MLNGAAPAFDLEGGAAMAVVRAAWVAALCCGFGAVVFRVFLVGRALTRMQPAIATSVVRRLRTLARCGVWGGLALAPIWLLLVAGDIADADGLRQAMAAMPAVLIQTVFGHVLLAQMIALAAAATCLAAPDRPGWRGLVVLLTGAALLLQAGHGHAAAMTSMPAVLPADIVHLLAAALWLGCLPPLIVVTWTAPPEAAAVAARDFTPLGRLCVLGVAASAVVQGWVLIGTVPGLVGTAYGWMALVKFALLAVLLGFAAANRYRLAPALLRRWPERARDRLLLSLALQTGFGVAVIAAAAVLTALPPAVHVQPVWPFTERLSLGAVREDPDFRREVLWAALALAGAVALLAAAIAMRWRWRMLALLAAVAIAWNAVPHLDLLLAEASPATYFHSPTGFSAEAIMQGAALYPVHCASCHGAQGRGDGPLAAGLPEPPADLTAAHLWMHSDGELFWWLAHGIAAPEGGGLAMPGFAPVLSEDDRWDLIDFIRARNAGLVRAGTGAWSPPLAAPGFAATCMDGGTVTLADLRQIARVVIGRAGATVLAATRACSTEGETVPKAYALVAGIAPDRIAGAQFLIDAQGWLRAVQPAGAAPGWDDPAVLAAAIARLRTPLPAAAPDRMAM